MVEWYYRNSDDGRRVLVQGNEARDDEQLTDVDNRDDNDAPGRVISLLSIGYRTSG